MTNWVRLILIPVDFSNPSRQAVKVGVALAGQIGAAVTLLSVLDVADMRVAVEKGLVPLTGGTDLHGRVQQWIESQFDELSAGTKVECERVVRRGVAELEIVSAIEKYAPDLVVMGSTGLAKRIPFGSTTEFVIRHTEVPILLVRVPRKKKR